MARAQAAAAGCGPPRGLARQPWAGTDDAMMIIMMIIMKMPRRSGLRLTGSTAGP